jgi:hypothetical protein
LALWINQGTQWFSGEPPEKPRELGVACVHRDIPKDLTLSAEERTHPLTPHLVVLAIEV